MGCRKKPEKSKRRQGVQDGNMHVQLGRVTDPNDLQDEVDSMKNKYHSLCDEHEKMIAEGKKSQQAYIRREVQVRMQGKERAEDMRGVGQSVESEWSWSVATRGLRQIS